MIDSSIGSHNHPVFLHSHAHACVYLAPRYDTVGDADDDAALAVAGSQGPTALSDGSGIASCGVSTQGIDADTGDCSCGTSSDTTTFSLDVLVMHSRTRTMLATCRFQVFVCSLGGQCPHVESNPFTFSSHILFAIY